MKKRLFAVLLVALMCASIFAVEPGVLSAGGSGNGSGNSTINQAGEIKPLAPDPKLDIAWEMNASQEIYEVGFTGDKTISSADVNVANKLTLTTVQTTDDYHGEGIVNVYWKIRTTHPFAIKMSANGPLVTVDGNEEITALPEEAQTNAQEINWTATWRPKSVSSTGTTDPVASGDVVLGVSDATIGDAGTYTTAQPVFTMTQDAATAPGSSMIKNGLVEVQVVTQNVLGVDKNPTKVTGNYTGYLTLTVAAQ